MSYTYTSCPPYNLAAGLCAIGLVCTIPYFFGIHIDSFQFTIYGSYFRVATFVLIVFNLFVGWTAIKYTTTKHCGIAIGMEAAGICCVMFNLMFGIRSASVVTCGETIAVACIEDARSCQVTGSVRAWMGVLYLLGLSLTLCAQVTVTQAYMIFTMLQRIGLGLDFPKPDLDQSSMEMHALQGRSLDQTAFQPAVFEPIAKTDVSKPLVVTTESSAASKPAVKPKKPGKAVTERKAGAEQSSERLYDSPWTRAAKK